MLWTDPASESISRSRHSAELFISRLESVGEAPTAPIEGQNNDGGQASAVLVYPVFSAMHRFLRALRLQHIAGDVDFAVPRAARASGEQTCRVSDSPGSKLVSTTASHTSECTQPSSGKAALSLSGVLIAIPLSITTYRIERDSLETRSTPTAVDTWLEGTNYESLRVDVNGSRVTYSVVGFGATPRVKMLADAVAVALKRPVVVSVRMIP